jgi:glycosyltransferase involved in cell wall biosynthesis
MRVGSLVFATQQGLGYLAKSFVDAGIVTDVVVVRHGSRPQQDWYPDAREITDFKDRRQLAWLDKWCYNLDVLLAFETPFSWQLFDMCKANGVKTVLMPNYECSPVELPSIPDLFLCPSLLDLEYFVDSGRPTEASRIGLRGLEFPFEAHQSRWKGSRAMFAPVPVQPHIIHHLHEKAETFVHNAGHGGLMGRNGTAELLEAWQYVKSDAKLLVRSQRPLLGDLGIFKHSRVEKRIGYFSQDSLWKEGDVCVHPTKWDGLSLPIQEAFASGMPVVTGDRFPMSSWLPREPLIPIREYRRNRVSPRMNEFDEAIYDPKDIAATIDRLYGTNIADLSIQGLRYKEANSWQAIGPSYRKVLEDLVEGKI